MSGLGEKLKHEREAQRISLEEISAATKISVRLLQAIETEQFDRLPGGIFNLNFVRQYARHLRLDEEQIVGEFRALTTSPDSQLEEQTPMLPPEWSRMENGYDSGISREPQLWKWATLAIAMLGVASAVYLWRIDRQSQRAADAATASRGAADSSRSIGAPPVVTPAVVTPPDATTGAPAQQAPVQADAAAGIAPAMPPEPLAATHATASPASAPADAPVRVELRATEVVWVSASADGTPRFQAILQPEQTRSVAAQSIVRLRVGNAGGLLVTLNGAAQPAIGPKGQVRTVVFTPNGMQIVMPSPDSAASGGPTSRGAGAQAFAGQ